MANERINYPLTLEKLEKFVKQAIKKYGKDKYVLLSDDEEGNGFHECYYQFSSAKEFDYANMPYDLKREDCVVLG